MCFCALELSEKNISSIRLFFRIIMIPNKHIEAHAHFFSKREQKYSNLSQFEMLTTFG
jgi:hypothetical protein